MRIIKKILFAFLIFIVLLSLAFLSYRNYQKPQYEGEKNIVNLIKPAEVYFDDYGIPHIYAQNQLDAMVALGYVHAQDRLWQMELLRRIAPGRLSEILGTKTLKTDLFFSGLGIDDSSAKAIKTIDKKSQPYLLANAYLDGLNQFIENGKTPIEFTLLGVKKSKFTLKDVYNTFGFMAFSFAMAQKTDPFLTDIRNKLGVEYLKDLGINYKNEQTKNDISDIQKQNYASISKSIATLLNKVPVAPFVGSNAWIVGSNKTESGKVLFSNDPHIEYSQPGTWYEAHISTPDFENYGYYVAGTPFPLLGHNRKYAFGMTMFENDDADFFQEKLNPNNKEEYSSISGYKKILQTSKIIKVKDSIDVKLVVKSTIHGPIINNLLQDFNNVHPVSLSWIHTQLPNNGLEATYGLSHSNNLVEFEQHISTLASPGLNIMYGDAENNIAWFTTGKLYKLEKNVNPNFILSGTNGIDEKRAFLDFTKNPKAINPIKNYVFSSNNAPEAIDGYQYPGYYLPEDRAKRITSLLEKKNSWNATSGSEMLIDNTSDHASANIKFIASIIKNSNLSENEKISVSILNKWTGTNNLEDIAPTIYNKMMFFYLKNTFSDEMGAKNFDQFLKTHLVKHVIGLQLRHVQSLWWDDVSTKNIVESRSDILVKSFKETIANLEIQHGKNVTTWYWKKAHQLEIKHALGSVAILRPFFNIKNKPIAGSCEVINNTMFTYSNDAINVVKAGPSSRRLIDFSNIENCLSILPSGNSGNPFSKHYDDQAQLYVEGKFRKMMLNKKEIISKSTLLKLIPNK